MGARASSPPPPSPSEATVNASGQPKHDPENDEPAADSSQGATSASLPSHQQEETAVHSSTQPEQGKAEPVASGFVDVSAGSHPLSAPVEVAKSTSSQSEHQDEPVADSSQGATSAPLPSHQQEETAVHSSTQPEKGKSGHSPSLRELDQLPGVATIWYRLGLQLGVRADDLDMIEQNYSRDVYMCKIKMFAGWRRGDTDPTYETLVRALTAVGKRKLAESVCSAQGISPSVLDATDAIKMHQTHEEMESDAVAAAKATIGHLQNEYEQLVIMTQEAVKAKSPTLTAFRTSITLRLPEPTKSELETSLMKKLQFIYDAKSIDTIFGILNLSIWSYLNFGLLQHIVEVYGDDELQQRMLKYATSVETFRKQTTLEVFWKVHPVTRECPEIPTKLRESLKRITFKHGNLDPTTTTLNDIERYRQDLARQYSFPDFTIILADIEKGCVATIWLVPPSLAAKLADELKRGNVSFLEQQNILELKIQESTVYHSEAAQTTDGATSGHSQTEGSVPEISFSDLEIGDELGEGAFGVVYRGHWKSRDMDVAIKRVPGKINKTEIEILNTLKHPCIIQFHGVVVDRPGPPEYYIITELAEGGSLYDLIHKKNYQPSQEESLRWAEQIAQGMMYLHQEKMMHRDLKSSNVLLTGKGNIKICDFGDAKHFDHTTKQTQTGTYRWMAPEVMKGEPVSQSSDVFSYGMLLYEILTGELPFADAKTDMVVINKLMSGEVPLIPASMESYMAKTLKQCWNANPKARPSFHDILEILTNREHATGQQPITIRGIQWRTGKDTPEIIYRGAAVSHGKMAYFNSVFSTSVYSYDSQGQLWQRLPDCHSRYSALVMANNKLTTVGGIDQQWRPTNSLASLTGEGKDSKWAELFPRMPTARDCLAAVCMGRNVIAAGGYDGDGRKLSTVEILDTDLRQWSSAASLPHPMTLASITVCGDLLYLLGGFDQNGLTLSVLTSSITDLLHQQQETANQPAVWRRAADAPYYGSTAVGVGGQLLAIGGCDEASENTSAIVAYDPTSHSWQDMGHMTTPRWKPLVALLPSNELIVAGGGGGEKKVEIGNVV